MALYASPLSTLLKPALASACLNLNSIILSKFSAIPAMPKCELIVAAPPSFIKASCAQLRNYILFLVYLIFCSVAFGHAAASTFSEEFYVSAGSGNVNIQDGGQAVQLVLTESSASGFTSINKYLFGSISVQIKLVPGNSAGTVTAYYLSSMTDSHDEVDIEFLGNTSGQPYVLQTNLFASGVGGREMRHYLWFDPTSDFHTYSVLWNRQQIVFFVDSTPIRVFANNEAYGVAYPNKQPMGVLASIYDGDSWATQGGRVKIDWVAAPFVATFDNFQMDACKWGVPAPPCAAPKYAGNWWDQPQYKALTPQQLTKLRWVQHHYLIYDYCTDKARYPQPPLECQHNP